MSLPIAVDRLYTTGWLPDGSDLFAPADLDRLPTGLRYPTVAAVRRLFADAGLELAVTEQLIFTCHRATWRPIAAGGDDRFGTVVGNTAAEAAVYALAHARSAGLLATTGATS